MRKNSLTPKKIIFSKRKYICLNKSIKMMTDTEMFIEVFMEKNTGRAQRYLLSIFLGKNLNLRKIQIEACRFV